MIQPILNSFSDLKPQEVVLETLHPEPFFDISFPADITERFRQVEPFSSLPLIVVSPDNSILAGFDVYRFFLSRGTGRVTVLTGELTRGDALCLNYNIANALFSLNLLEKLIFVQRILTVSEPAGIYRRVKLDINVNRDLRSKIDLLLSPQFRHLLSHDAVNLKTALRICDLDEVDRPSAIILFQSIPFTSSQCLQILEILEEICFRDKTTVEKILAAINFESQSQLKKPQQAIIQAITRLRYPMAARAEDEWQNRLKALNLPAYIKVSHTPFFEKKNIAVTVTLEKPEHLETFLRKILEG